MLHAGEVRLCPILGLVPLAVAVIGGLVFSTLFTLILAPLPYVALERRKVGT